jgi:hypothetical protein
MSSRQSSRWEGAIFLMTQALRIRLLSRCPSGTNGSASSSTVPIVQSFLAVVGDWPRHAPNTIPIGIEKPRTNSTAFIRRFPSS